MSFVNRCEWCGAEMGNNQNKRVDRVTGKTYFLCSRQCINEFNGYEPHVVNIISKITSGFIEDDPNSWGNIAKIYEDKYAGFTIGGVTV